MRWPSHTFLKIAGAVLIVDTLLLALANYLASVEIRSWWIALPAAFALVVAKQLLDGHPPAIQPAELMGGARKVSHEEPALIAFDRQVRLPAHHNVLGNGPIRTPRMASEVSMRSLAQNRQARLIWCLTAPFICRPRLAREMR